jgi:hypothetical protein
MIRRPPLRHNIEDLEGVLLSLATQQQCSLAAVAVLLLQRHIADKVTMTTK